MGIITYKIDSDQKPFTVQLTPGFPVQSIAEPGIYQITDVPDGDYILKVTDKNGCVVNAPVSVSTFMGISTTTTTEELTTTTTTTGVEIVPCNMIMFVQNGGEYEKIYQIQLSSAIGAVSLRTSSAGLPIKFALYFDDIEVINTGYIGNSSYQLVLDTMLEYIGQPLETMVEETNVDLSFIKGSATDYAYLHVYTPFPNVSGIFSVSCVDDAYIETYEASFTNGVCELSETWIPVTTTEVTTTTTTCIGIEERDILYNLTSIISSVFQIRNQE